ncbi:glycine betaine ABC transporter substrate-binding protein [Streptomyces sp. SID3343]|uniref:glycine betaine ABC transporter substrate-binding protein n=1 Tax=Streptomyces sp. SID3343 TaxID=2690260 RepID=UPI00136CFAF7|nr:glycine betaine ABC transporter substrate-binding protein [Streptomyces sp. SID3343]MYW05382.1 glycine/betaine ABC transporter substrate-binding protein [Streptomyces sp. SID3343]
MAHAVLRASLSVVLAFALGSACGLQSGLPLTTDAEPGSIRKEPTLDGKTLTVSSKEFSEQLVLGEIAGLALKVAGANVIDKTNIKGSIGAREALKKGSVDLYWEYTGTAWINYLGHTTPITDPQQQWEAVARQDLSNHIVWLPPAPLNNTYAFAGTQANMRRYALNTLSDVAVLAKRDNGAVTFCVENEFAARGDGLGGVLAAYGIKVPDGNIRKMQSGLIYTETAKGSTCLLGEVFTTDGRIQAMNLKVLEDDKHFFPNYNAAVTINEKTYKKYPVIKDVMAPITAKLTTDVMRSLNAEVDVAGREPRDVAEAWLKQEGFIT